MSGVKVIGAISAVISILDASIKIYDNAKRDLRLSETFKAVGSRLPILLATLEKCKSDLHPVRHSLPADISNALDTILTRCDENAGRLREIFEKVISGEHDTWHKRYVKVVNRFGKGNKVEELMVSITEDVQLLVNHNAVKSAGPEQLEQLGEIVKEMKSVQSSIQEEEDSSMTFNSQGGAQTNNVNSGSGQQINNNASVGTQNFVNKLREDLSFRKPVGLCLGQAPDIGLNLFVGREQELAEIQRFLRPEDLSLEQQRLVLGGTGGMGKTQLAIAFATRHYHSQKYDSVFWLNAASEVTVKHSFRLMAEAVFNVQDPDVLKGEQSLIHILQWLSDRKNTRWLLIFDNYDEPDQYPIKQYYPQASHGSIIVTTRRPDLVEGRAIRLQPLQSLREHLKILETRSKRTNIDSDVHAQRLAKRLAGLPLALATAGAYLHQSTLSFERYLEEYERSWNIDPRRSQKLPEYEERTLYTTWDLSYDRLKHEDAEAAKLLGLLPYFSNQRLWYKLFQAGLSKDLPQWLYVLVSSDLAFESAMRTLTDYCFLEVQVSVASWSMHTCVHDWTFAILNREVDTKQYWYSFDCVGTLVERESFSSLQNIRLTDLTAHALRLEYVSRYRGDVLRDLTNDRVKRIWSIAELLRQQVQPLAAEEMYLRALQGSEKALRAEHMCYEVRRTGRNRVRSRVVQSRDSSESQDCEHSNHRAIESPNRSDRYVHEGCKLYRTVFTPR